LADLQDRFAKKQGFSIATINLDHTVKLRQDHEFCTAYGAHTHVTADGNPIVWLSRLAGQSDVNLVPGSELIEPLCKLAAQQKVPVALFGATEDSLDAAAKALRARIADIDVVLCLAPPMGFDPVGAAATEAIEKIRESGARLVFLALGGVCLAIHAVWQCAMPLVSPSCRALRGALIAAATQDRRGPFWRYWSGCKL